MNGFRNGSGGSAVSLAVSALLALGIGMASGAWAADKPGATVPAAGATLPNGAEKPTGPHLRIQTERGVVVIGTYPGEAPKTVARIVELARSGFYDGVVFHRVVPNFVVQGGDPTGTGAGGSGQKLKAEFNRHKHVEGSVAMARTPDPDSADSQFYIALAALPSLDGTYTVFGQVLEGMDVVRGIRQGDHMIKVTVE
ncbi:MAG: peptidylprolyl isomerase [Nitrospirota bacterium]|nr:peptidylprolyl isomerase [Nitrospirota bacterium]